MKKINFLWTMMMGAGCLLFLQGYSSGPAASNLDATGGPLSTNNCSGCHGGGSFNTNASIAVTEMGGGAAVTSYNPGQSYLITFTVTASGNSAYGMQLVSLDGNNAQAGAFSSPSANGQISNFSGQEYFEHNNRSTSGTFSVTWTAPAAGAGTVKLFGAGMAVNSDFGTNGDDPSASINLALTESPVTGVRTVAERDLELSIFPVPNNGSFTLQNNQSEPVQRVRILTLMGQQVAQQNVYLAKGNGQVLSFDELAPGVYTVVAEGETLRQVQNIVVQ